MSQVIPVPNDGNVGFCAKSAVCPRVSAVWMADCLKQALRDWRSISDDEQSDFTVKWIENRAIEIFRERAKLLVNGGV